MTVSDRAMTKAEGLDGLLQAAGFGWIELLEQMPGFVMITSGPDHRVEFGNAALLELSRYRDIMGRTLAEALPELADQGFLALRDEVYRTGIAYRGAKPFQISRAPGGALEDGYIDFIYQPVKGRDGTVCGLIFAGQDISVQKQAEDRVRAMQFELVHMFRASAMGAMAMVLAHEVNQPLTAIGNYASAGRRLAEETGAAPQIAAAFEAIDAATRRGGEIIRGVREMIEKRRPRKERFDLAAGIREATALGLLDAARRGVAYKIDLAPDLFVSGDRIQFQQVIINLLRNAMEAMQDERRRQLEISATREGDAAEIRVSDTGHGIAEPVRARLFEPFFTTKEQGLGVGLSICRSLMERQGGRIWAEDRPGGGTIFCLSFPLDPSSAGTR